jgi:hypothetical protein
MKSDIVAYEGVDLFYLFFIKMTMVFFSFFVMVNVYNYNVADRIPFSLLCQTDGS